MIAPQLNKKGGRPLISVWRPRSGIGFQRLDNDSRLFPCLKSQDGILFLYENTVEQPVEFRKRDIIGILLRHPNKSLIEPYFIHQESFFSYYDNLKGRNPQQYEQLDVNDNKMPLIFLHICKLKILIFCLHIYYFFSLQVLKKMDRNPIRDALTTGIHI